ncbi:hypothetical protein BV898_09807 [Hypsibius exemplaris]|uniref:Protein TsetseEP domain-containing protein n=1 Tax=Hypsibius exemplaris TaxID=2072580 RepID=A0A1W0WLJ6_HYPEX|nr:hypothetical protein BV898_09807 [Hypsibius exemplaris]
MKSTAIVFILALVVTSSCAAFLETRRHGADVSDLHFLACKDVPGTSRAEKSANFFHCYYSTAQTHARGSLSGSYPDNYLPAQDAASWIVPYYMHYADNITNVAAKARYDAAITAAKAVYDAANEAVDIKFSTAIDAALNEFNVTLNTVMSKVLGVVQNLQVCVSKPNAACLTDAINKEAAMAVQVLTAQNTAASAQFLSTKAALMERAAAEKVYVAAVDAATNALNEADAGNTPEKKV